VPILRIAAAVGVLRAMQGLVSNVYFAKGRPQINLKVNLALLPLAVIAVLVGSLWGTLGVATGLLLVSAVSLATTRIALRLVGVRSRDALAAALPATAASMVMGAGVWLVNAFVIPGSAGPVSALVASVCIGVGLFGAALVLLAPATARELWSMLRHLRSQPA
jgi:O-antigen/teichoic acid export membrane protein